MNNLVIQTVIRNWFIKMAVLLLGMAGSALASHGLATNDQVQQAIDPLAQIIAGALLSLVAAGIAWLRSISKREKEVNLLVAKPDEVTVRGAIPLNLPGTGPPANAG